MAEFWYRSRFGRKLKVLILKAVFKGNFQVVTASQQTQAGVFK